MSNTEQTVGQTLETMALPQPAPATASSPVSSYRDKMIRGEEQFRRQWINSRLNLDRHHPDVVALQEAVFSFCQGVAASPKRGKRYVIYGNNGTAKSRSGKAVARWVRERAIDLPLVDAEEGMRLIDCVMVNWAERVDAFKDNPSIDDLVNATVLIIDDIGAEHDPWKAGAEKLYLLLERRESKWTMITTNLLPDEWEFRFERRISDRLFRNSVHVDLTKVPSYSHNT